MRFLADMGVSMKVADWLRDQGHDVIHLRDEQLQRLDDGSIFEKARSESRVLITFDLDFGEIAALTGDKSCGIILFRLRNTRAPHVLMRLMSVLRVSSAELETGAVVTVEDSRHRVRMLPIQ